MTGAQASDAPTSNERRRGRYVGWVMAAGLAAFVPLTAVVPQGLQIALPLVLLTVLAGARPSPAALWAPVSLVAALAVWPALVALRSAEPNDALETVVASVAMGLCAALLIAAGGREAPRRAGLVAGAALAVSLVAILGDLATAGRLMARFRGEGGWYPYVHNRAITMAALVVWYVAALMVREGRRGVAVSLIALTGTCALASASGAAMLAWSAGGIVWVLARWSAGARRFLGPVIVAAAVAMPLVVWAALGVLGQGARAMDRLTVGVRLDIWAASLNEMSWWGKGIRHLRTIDIAAIGDVFADERVNHPHNAFLQIPLDLGWPGTAALAVVLAATCRGLHAARLAQVHLASLAAAVAAAAVSWDIWATWWLAALGLLAALGAWLERTAPAG